MTSIVTFPYYKAVLGGCRKWCVIIREKIVYTVGMKKKSEKYLEGR
jgi:hypothetical protein